MSQDHPHDAEDGALLAAEYVLGMLSGQERRAFEGRLALEPVLRTEVEYWEQRFGSLAAEVEPVAPPPRTWTNIERALREPGEPRSGLRNLFDSLAFWRMAAIGSAAVAAASVVALITVVDRTRSNTPLVARLDLGGGQAGFVAAIDRGRNGLTIIPASMTDVNQRVLEIWLIAPGDPPRSLGLIAPQRAVHIDVPPDVARRLTAEATLAVSLEPAGGSPTGAPTGPVIANGKLTNL